MMSALNQQQNIKYAVFVLLTVALTWWIPLTWNLSFNQGLVFRWLCILALATYIGVTINLWVGLFVVLALVTSHYPRPTGYSGEALLMVTLGAVLYVVAYHSYDRKAFLWLLVLVATVNFVALVFQRTGFEYRLAINQITGLAHDDIRQGLFGRRNSLSAMFAICLPAFFGHKSRLWMLGIGMVLAGLVMAKSVGGVLAAVPTMLYYGYKWLCGHMPPAASISLIASVLVCAGLIFVSAIDSPGINGRWSAWKTYGQIMTDALWVNDTVHQATDGVRVLSIKKHDYVLDKPWVGKGLGHWKVIFNIPKVMYKIGNEARTNHPSGMMYYAQAHNEYIQAVFEMGWPVIVVIVGFFCGIFRAAKNIDQRLVLVLLAVSISAQVHFIFHIPLLAIVIIASLAAIEKESRWSKQL